MSSDKIYISHKQPTASMTTTLMCHLVSFAEM